MNRFIALQLIRKTINIMKKELFKILKTVAILGIVWILFDLLFYYLKHDQFSLVELKKAFEPVIIMFISSFVYVYIKSFKK